MEYLVPVVIAAAVLLYFLGKHMRAGEPTDDDQSDEPETPVFERAGEDGPRLRFETPVGR